ncbi:MULTISPECIES: T9SS type A sorting domain-containing protein [unclassified Arcicella]|uniref:T9SS type A sorting domain-containing protein n=1 Tax=unclassified Arcicella TaxID=2644986 RepID=UPI00285F2A23|nr:MULTISPECIES: T9SS type A sorting domain-containing protein [unclassified Arcicella]MDR6562095.1 hypothetical protein [Arcicella sp. BE51]MDR6811967.1 hypothetical protein [Arcicella sp. BE140]MDR6822997.1 hypothetical protein [Arcicella sp. BE139]
MLRFLQLFFTLLLLNFSINAQTIEINSVEGKGYQVCLGQKVKVSYRKSGVFNQGNTFKLQIKAYSSDTWDEVSAIDSSGYLVATLPTALSIKYMEANVYADLRVISTSPAVENRKYSFYLYSIPSVEIIGATKNTIYPYENVGIKLNVQGSSPISIMTIDSLSTEYNFYETGNQINNNLMVNPAKTGSFSFLSVSNMCGIGIIKGSASFSVLQNSLNITGVSNINVCRNKMLEVYTTKTGIWANDDKFYIRLINSSNRVFDFEATEINGGFAIKINPELLLDHYSLQVVSKRLGIESNNYSSGITVYSEPVVEIVSSESTINFGDRKNLILKYSGYGAFKIEMSDGQIINSFSSNKEDNTSVEINPLKTTEYYIKSFSSTCGNGVGKEKVKITVLEGIKADSIKVGEYCEGSTCEVKFLTNAQISVGSLVKVKLVYYDREVELKATVIKENIASFTIPEGMSGMTSYSKAFAIVYTDKLPNIFRSPNYIDILTKPSAEISFPFYDVTLATPQAQNITVDVRGGKPFELVLSDSTKYVTTNGLSNGEIWTQSFTVPVYVANSKTFSVKSITNVCGTKIGSQNRLNVKVNTQENALRLLSSKAVNDTICVGRTLDLMLLTSSNFNSDDLFKVSLFNNYLVEVTTLGNIKRGKSQIIIPTTLTSGYYYIGVTSSNGMIKSNTLPIAIQSKSRIGLSTSYTDLLAGVKTSFGIWIYGYGDNEVVFSDGSKKVYNSINGSLNTSFEKAFTQSSTFGITSINNQCGVGTVETKDITIQVSPYRIYIDMPVNYEYINNLCVNTMMSIPFQFVGNNNNQSFSIQIAKETDQIYTTLQSNIKVSPATVLLPSTLMAGKYKIRFISSDNVVKSNEVLIQVDTPPNAKLQLNDGTVTKTINAGEQIVLEINDANLTSSGIRTYIIQDNDNNKMVNRQSDSRYQYLYLTENKEYKLISAINKCGVGNTMSTVKITVKPVLGMKIVATTDNRYCIGSNLATTFYSQGKFEVDNVFKVYGINESNEKIELFKSVNNGSFSIPLGSNLKKGNYKIQFESTNPAMTKEIASVFITAKPDVTLSGGAIINAGSYVYLNVKNNDSYKSIYNTGEVLNYELSSGFKGSINGFDTDGKTRILFSTTTTQLLTIKSISNTCGVGVASGSASITVNPISEKQVNYIDYRLNFCAGSDQDIYFSTKGTFTSNNKFTVQLSDNTGKNFKDLVTEGTSSPLKTKIPTDTPLGDSYLIRVIASDNDVTSSTNLWPIAIYEGISVRFDTSSYYLNGNNPVTIKVKLKGLLPITFYMGTDEINAKRYSATSNDYAITVDPLNSTSYRLFSVSNQVCGTGTILSPSTVKLELITATEEAGKLGINVFPNPTSDIVNIESDGKELDIQLIDFSGKIIQEEKLRGEQKRIDMSKVSTGTYFLHIKKEGRQAVFKVLKQ